MTLYRVSSEVFDPPAHEHFQVLLSSTDLRGACGLAGPWRFRYDDGLQRVTAVNSSYDVLRQVQLFAADLLGSFMSLPATVLPGRGASYDLFAALRHIPEEQAMFFIRWVDPEGRRLLWPVSW